MANLASEFFNELPRAANRLARYGSMTPPASSQCRAIRMARRSGIGPAVRDTVLIVCRWAGRFENRERSGCMAEEKKSGPPPRTRRRRGRGRSRAPVSDRPVPLHKRSASHFQRGDRQRGQEYYQEGRVRLEVDGARARARVEGTERQTYAVGIDWSRVGDRVLHAFCECPRFADRRPCKHLWAMLLALEPALENQPPGRDRVSLRKDRATNWRDLGISVGQGDRSKPQSMPAPGRRAHHARPPRQRRRPVTGASLWRSQLAAIGEKAARYSRASTGAMPPPSDIFLLVNTAASLGTRGLILDVFGRKRGARGKQAGKLKRASIDPERLESLLQPARPPERRSTAS